MAFNAARIHGNAARIFMGMTAPTTGLPPTLATHTNGVPGTGIEVGYTEDEAMIRYKGEKQAIPAEQALANVDVMTVSELAEIEVTVKEHTYATLQRAFDNIGTVSDGSKDLFYFGGGSSVLQPRTECVFLSSRQRNAPTKFIIMVLYKAYCEVGYETGYTRKKESLYKLKFVGLADGARNDGDQLGQWFYEK
jgi:hypothetical protein